MNKKELRKVLRQMSREELTEDMRTKASNYVRDRLLAHPAFVDAKHVALYMALGDEPDVATVVREACAMGKVVSLPKVLDVEQMDFYRTTVDATLSADNAYGIEEPEATPALLVNPAEIDLIVVPALGFDKKKYRLGRGKGYYDRYLARCPQAYKLGVTIGMLSIETLDADPWDLPMDEVIAGM